MSAAPMLPPAIPGSTEPLWRRALRRRHSLRLHGTNRGGRSRLALQDIIGRAGLVIDLVRIRTWSRALQGEAYLWALDMVNGAPRRTPPWQTWEVR